MEQERRLILLVESDPRLSALIAAYLRHDGFEVLSLQRLADLANVVEPPCPVGPSWRRPVLVLLDLDDLDEEGRKELERLDLLPVVLLVSDRTLLRRAGPDRELSVLYKPFTMQQLRRLVRGAFPGGEGQR